MRIGSNDKRKLMRRCFLSTHNIDTSSKKSCQGCDLPSDDIPDSTSSSRGHNNNTPSATNNNSKNLGNGKPNVT